MDHAIALSLSEEDQRKGKAIGLYYSGPILACLAISDLEMNKLHNACLLLVSLNLRTALLDSQNFY
uniref:Uncharacterized protein n=1 Tax=Arundo donax TaxID=35708 RepID=A0A0A9FLK7_ARUDO